MTETKKCASLVKYSTVPKRILRRRANTNKNKNNKPSLNSTQNKDPQFKNVMIYADSHGRNVAGLLRRETANRYKVMGICKPSARLDSILPPNNAEDNQTDSCMILIAGSNDVTTGMEEAVYNSIENALAQNTNKQIILSTLPHRHDLPGHDRINEEIALLNAFIFTTMTIS